MVAKLCKGCDNDRGIYATYLCKDCYFSGRFYKDCKMCGISLPLAMFYPNRGSCRPCYNEYTRKRLHHITLGESIIGQKKFNKQNLPSIIAEEKTLRNRLEVLKKKRLRYYPNWKVNKNGRLQEVQLN